MNTTTRQVRRAAERLKIKRTLSKLERRKLFRMKNPQKRFVRQAIVLNTTGNPQ